MRDGKYSWSAHKWRCTIEWISFLTFIFNSTFYAANKSDIEELITRFVWEEKSEFMNITARTVIDFESLGFALLLHAAVTQRYEKRDYFVSAHMKLELVCRMP